MVLQRKIQGNGTAELIAKHVHLATTERVFDYHRSVFAKKLRCVISWWGLRSPMSSGVEDKSTISFSPVPLHDGPALVGRVVCAAEENQVLCRVTILDLRLVIDIEGACKSQWISAFATVLCRAP